MKFTKSNFDSFRNDVEKALKDVAKKYDVNINAGNISYSDVGFRMSLNVEKTKVNGKPARQVQFEQYASLYGLNPSDFGKTFSYKNETYRIVGVNTNSRKYQIAVERIFDKKEYGFNAVTVKNHLSDSKVTMSSKISRKQQIADLLKNNPDITNSQIAAKLGTNASYVARLVKQLKNQ